MEFPILFHNTVLKTSRQSTFPQTHAGEVLRHVMSDGGLT